MSDCDSVKNKIIAVEKGQSGGDGVLCLDGESGMAFLSWWHQSRGLRKWGKGGVGTGGKWDPGWRGGWYKDLRRSMLGVNEDSREARAAATVGYRRRNRGQRSRATLCSLVVMVRALVFLHYVMKSHSRILCKEMLWSDFNSKVISLATLRSL